MTHLSAHARATFCGLVKQDVDAVWPAAAPSLGVCDACAAAWHVALEKAKPLIGVYFQTSAHYRHVCRLPEGKTGIEALTEAARSSVHDAADWAQRMGEVAATDQYLRVYAPRDLQLTLDRNTWAAYKALGGGTVDR